MYRHKAIFSFFFPYSPSKDLYCNELIILTDMIFSFIFSVWYLLHCFTVHFSFNHKIVIREVAGQISWCNFCTWNNFSMFCFIWEITSKHTKKKTKSSVNLLLFVTRKQYANFILLSIWARSISICPPVMKAKANPKVVESTGSLLSFYSWLTCWTSEISTKIQSNQ